MSTMESREPSSRTTTGTPTYRQPDVRRVFRSIRACCRSSLNLLKTPPILGDTRSRLHGYDARSRATERRSELTPALTIVGPLLPLACVLSLVNAATVEMTQNARRRITKPHCSKRFQTGICTPMDSLALLERI